MTRSYGSFEELFRAATGYEAFPYQVAWGSAERQPALVSVPTGLGKTAAALLSWIWQRRFAPEAWRERTPRRLVYCLPMRVLVEQTRDCARAWLRALDLLAADAPSLHPPERIAVHVLMGGDLEADWDRWPDRDQVLIGTLDMLLSRALNRGYAMSRFRWPVQFALLNNDCLWVMDEVQLMGNGLATTAQLQAFRRQLGVARAARSVWMSATMRAEWLETVDFSLGNDAPGSLELGDADQRHPEVHARLQATKPLSRAPLAAGKDGKAEAAFIAEQHRTSGGLTLVVVNTVRRATQIYEALAKLKADAELVLVHSHFRPPDRRERVDRLLATPSAAGTIAVSTQVVEAGVDVSATLLLTDLAPWPSLVQRFGRCNRRGDVEGATVQWFDIDTTKKGSAAPYDPHELETARARLSELESASPARLPAIEGSARYSHVLRRRDLVELFDTTPDLAGADIDVSRFIREADEHNVQLFWRELAGGRPPADLPAPRREELCPVPIADADEFAAKHELWCWDHLDRQWRRPRPIYPGMVLLASGRDGGYLPEQGWQPKSKRQVPTAESVSAPPEADDGDPLAEKPWQTLAEHTEAVVEHARQLAELLDTDLQEQAKDLITAARWHDAGKAHPVYQSAVLEASPNGAMAMDRADVVWGKAPTMARYRRPGFRHELASALAMLELDLPDLAAYLAAAHHGKVRLSIRSLPHETPPNDPERLFARGVHDGDVLSPADLGAGVQCPGLGLDLSCMELGDGRRGPSWLARAVALRDRLGPFRLGFLEALLRVADWRASAAEGGTR